MPIFGREAADGQGAKKQNPDEQQLSLNGEVQGIRLIRGSSGQNAGSNVGEWSIR